MNLDEIQSGSLCVADTNVMLYAEQGQSIQCRRFLQRCATGELLIVLPQTVWHELTHKLMLAEALMIGGIAGPAPASKLARKPDLVKGLSLYKQKILALFQMGLGFETNTREDLLDRAFAYQKKYGFLTKDSLILATAVRLKADVLATADAAFADIRELSVAMPSDLLS